MSEPTEMELRVAKVLYAMLSEDPETSVPFESAVDLARAAIRAMREPTEDMVADGWLSAGRVGWDGPATCWQAMIEAASPENQNQDRG